MAHSAQPPAADATSPGHPEEAAPGAADSDATAGGGTSSEHGPTAPPPWALLAPLAVGSDVGLGWRITALSAVNHGAAVLSLNHEDGADARVHLCSISGAPRGVAHSDHVDLMLMNHGDGRLQTREEIGRVLKTLAGLIRHNERSAAAKASGLMPHALRVGCFRSQRCLT